MFFKKKLKNTDNFNLNVFQQNSVDHPTRVITAHNLC